jgi:hypothetical protein
VVTGDHTVSLFGPPGLATCYHVPDALKTGPRSSASGRFALIEKVTSGAGVRSYRRRLTAGATEADCTFAPAARQDARFLDVSATDAATGAQSDTRSYLVRPTSAAAARKR